MSYLSLIPGKAGPRRGWSFVWFPRRIGNSAFSLRLLRRRDLPALYPLFGEEVFARSAGRARRPFGSLPSFRRWLRGEFRVVYLAERPAAGVGRILGFAGLYDLQPHRSVSLSMAVFDPADRRRGLGELIMETLCVCLRGNAIAQVVFAEVRQDNPDSLGFLHALGFAVCGERDGYFLLERRL